MRLSDIVDVYLGQLQRMETMDLEVATEFLLIAATLIELKSKRLLPDDGDVDLDDELALWEERDLLLSRLVECKTFKDAAGRHGGDRQRRRPLLRPHRRASRSGSSGCCPTCSSAPRPTTSARAFLRAVAPKPVPHVDIAHVHQIRVTVTDAVAELLDELPGLGRATFADLTADLVDRIEVIVHFLAVLELFKQGWIDLEQPETFGGLHVVWLGEDDVDAEDLAFVDAYDG